VAVLGGPFRPLSGYHVLLPAFDPVRGNTALRVGKSHPAGAHFRVKLIFELVFFLPSGPGGIQLRPQVPDVVRTAELKRDQMVDFAAVGSSSPAIFRVYLVAHGLGEVAMLGRPANRANVGRHHGRQRVVS